MTSSAPEGVVLILHAQHRLPPHVAPGPTRGEKSESGGHMFSFRKAMQMCGTCRFCSYSKGKEITWPYVALRETIFVSKFLPGDFITKRRKEQIDVGRQLAVVAILDKNSLVRFCLRIEIKDKKEAHHKAKPQGKYCLVPNIIFI